MIDPKPCIRHIGDTISKSALMRRQLCADGHTMYMFSEELFDEERVENLRRLLP